jgi:ACS family tartrate transporter-like MFS transporter
MNTQAVSDTDLHEDEALAAATLRKVAWRLIPFLLLAYICNLLDRGNVAFTKLKMQPDLGMSDFVYSTGVGLFYLGYLLFEVPSNLILGRTGARAWIARIMITWGLVSACTMFVVGPASFFTVRILLGVAEAGFFPGIILYLTQWFPARARARAIASFMAANAVGGMIVNALSGLIMFYTDGVAGLHGWQWVFLLEGLPSVVLGVVVLFYLTDRPEQATWLAADQRAWLAARINREEQYREQRHGSDVWRGLVDRRVWHLILLYFTAAFVANAGGLYLPELIRNALAAAGSQDLRAVGVLASVPSVCGLIAMLVNGAWADRTGKHRLHVAGSALLAAAGWALAAWSTSVVGTLVALCLALMGLMSLISSFWALPTSFLSGAAAAGGIALINSVGNIGGLTGPSILGLIKDTQGNLTWGLMLLAVAMVGGAVLALFAPHDPTLDQRRTSTGTDPTLPNLIDLTKFSTSNRRTSTPTDITLPEEKKP